MEILAGMVAAWMVGLVLLAYWLVRRRWVAFGVCLLVEVALGGVLVRISHEWAEHNRRWKVPSATQPAAPATRVS